MSESSVEQRIAECGRQLAMATVARYTTNGAVHPPTLVAACARMAGYFLFRSFRLNTTGIEPGTSVLSPEASEKSPVLLRTCAAVLKSLGHEIPANPPEPLVGDKVQAREAYLETQARLHSPYMELQEKFGLDEYQTARAAAVAAAVTAHTVRKNLDPVAAFGIAAFCIIEGSRTMPGPVGQGAQDGNA